MYFICGKNYDKEPTYKDFHNMVKSLIFTCSKNKSIACKIINNEDQYADIYADIVKAFYNYDSTKNSSINSWLSLQTIYAMQNTIRKFKTNPHNNYGPEITISYNNESTTKNSDHPEYGLLLEDKYETIRGRLKENKEELHYMINNSGLSDKQIRDISLYADGVTITDIAKQYQENKQTIHLRIKAAIEKIKVHA